MTARFAPADPADPHRNQPVAVGGTPVAEARAAMILLHGRGATADSILPLGDLFAVPGIAYVAPQARGYAWYPHSFLQPVERNEPHLSSALALVGEALEALAAAGVTPDRVVLGGFSQGACLAAEFAARNPRRYGGLAALSGGLIGAAPKAEDYAGSLDGTPCLLGCSDVDAHIPLERVQLTGRILAGLGGVVDERIYPGLPHTVNDDEIVAVRAMLAGLVGA